MSDDRMIAESGRVPSERVVVYVAMDEEGTAVWRPVPAMRVGRTYELQGPMPEGEVREFRPGLRVECVERPFADGCSGLVAVQMGRG